MEAIRRNDFIKDIRGVLLIIRIVSDLRELRTDQIVNEFTDFKEVNALFILAVLQNLFTFIELAQHNERLAFLVFQDFTPEIRIIDLEIGICFIRNEATLAKRITPIDHGVLRDTRVVLQNRVDVFFEEFRRSLALFFFVYQSENPLFQEILNILLSKFLRIIFASSVCLLELTSHENRLI